MLSVRKSGSFRCLRSQWQRPPGIRISTVSHRGSHSLRGCICSPLEVTHVSILLLEIINWLVYTSVPLFIPVIIMDLLLQIPYRVAKRIRANGAAAFLVRDLCSWKSLQLTPVIFSGRSPLWRLICWECDLLKTFRCGNFLGPWTVPGETLPVLPFSCFLVQLRQFNAHFRLPRRPPLRCPLFYLIHISLEMLGHWLWLSQRRLATLLQVCTNQQRRILLSTLLRRSILSLRYWTLLEGTSNWCRLKICSCINCCISH